MTPRSDMNSFIQTPSFAASEAAMYSASHVDPATTLCLELHQLTAPPFNVNTYPVCDSEFSQVFLFVRRAQAELWSARLGFGRRRNSKPTHHPLNSHCRRFNRHARLRLRRLRRYGRRRRRRTGTSAHRALDLHPT